MLNAEWLARLASQPAYCFTTDIDWASESMIEETLALFARAGVPLTPFVTHESPALARAYRGRETDVGLHPNFGQRSTHGTTVSEVVDHVKALWPQARSFRSHGFVDSSDISHELFGRGLRYDSNLCLHLQQNLVPLEHWTGLIRFPVFLEDDVISARSEGWAIEAIEPALRTPGLKIFNFHPVHICLNTPTSAYYQSVRGVIRDEWRAHVHAGSGARTLLEQLLAFVSHAPGLGVFSLSELYERLAGEAPGRGRHHLSVGRYEHARQDERATLVREVYDRRDPTDVYATSRDFNLRELEIDFLIDTLAVAQTGRSAPLRILDVGCGNGYSDLRVAEALDVDITGVDFSQTMIGGANQLALERADRTLGRVSFEVGDISRLPYDADAFDVVISERCLLNLPDEAAQDHAISEIRRVLRQDGLYLAVEGTRDGLHRLNELRARVGLDAIPDRGEDNPTSLKFDEATIERRFAAFDIVNRHYFGTYYLISRVIHPLAVAPNPPRFDAPVNAAARKVARQLPDIGRLGHVMGLVLRAR